MNEDLLEALSTLPDFSQKEKFSKIAELLATTRGELRRKTNSELQLSASALVFQGRRLFFIQHPYQKEWLLPAGHVERGETPLEAAIREFHEETGARAEETGQLVDVNLIKIPNNLIKKEPAHLHLDFRYLLKLKPTERESGELPTLLLERAQAPAEFQNYYHYNIHKEG